MEQIQKNNHRISQKVMLIIGLIVVLILGLSGCQQMRTKSFGGEMTIKLEENVKLEEITWKDDSIWYLTKPMLETDIAETHTFQQSSEMGVFEGTITIVETKN